MNGKWLEQKLNQNGFGPEDLAEQTGLSIKTIKDIIRTSEADPEDWNLILDTLNQYPAVRTPSSDILKDLEADLEQWGKDALCVVYYGVNQNLLGFTGYQNLSDLQYHGAPVNTEFLSTLQVTLQEAWELFRKQNGSLQKYS